MVRHLKPYSDAFMEFQPVKEDQQDIKLQNQRAHQQKPQVGQKQRSGEPSTTEKSQYPQKPQGMQQMLRSIDHKDITRQVQRNNFVDASSAKQIKEAQRHNNNNS